MFLHYEALTVDGKKKVLVDIQQGMEQPYYIAKKGLRHEEPENMSSESSTKEEKVIALAEKRADCPERQGKEYPLLSVKIKKKAFLMYDNKEVLWKLK